jgi:pyrroline-5-carboxylate reductase
MRIGVIGTGTISSAVVESIAKDGHQITVSERSTANSARLAAQYDCISVASNQTVLDQSDTIFIALMPETAANILGALTFHSDHRVISFMAGVSMDEVSSITSPARAEAVMLPFPNIAQKGSPILVRGDTGIIKMLFGAQNSIFELSNDTDLAAYLCAQAVLLPAVQMVSDAATWLSGRVEDTHQAQEFLRALVGTNLLGGECAPLLKALDTPGGYNHRLREHMVKQGMRTDITDGLDALDDG